MTYSTRDFMKLLLAPAFLLFVSGCLTAKKLDKVVAKQYAFQPTPQKKQKEYINITSGLSSGNDKASTTEAKTTNMLPLLFYWQFDYTNTCTINPQIPINNFKKTVTAYAEKGLRQKLNGQRLELSVDQIPNVFAIVDKAHLVWIIYAFGWDNISIQPVNTQMVVSYKVMQDDVEVKKGTISISGFDEKMKLGMFKSWKTATSEYLYQYDANITAVSKLVIDKLIAEL